MQQGKPYSILIVDDNPVFVDALEALIIDVAGSFIRQIDKAYNGIDGLNLILTNFYQYIFIDINMPGLSGIEVTRRVDWELYRREHNIIAISFHTEDEYMAEMLKAGAKHYLSKDQINHDSISAILNTNNIK